MTKESLWQAYVAANPSFAGDKPITIKPAGLKKLFEQTYEYGRDEGIEESIAVAQAAANRRGLYDIFSSFK